MFNVRELKIINGFEVLNKYVGQSEENICKMFVDVEKEYKEKGDEFGFYIIIFDELDVVCKQRGFGVGGGIGVGDSVVNQLFFKFDGVDQFNNILLIGMINRKDMIDDVLLWFGCLEVQIEIFLLDEFGWLQIFKIYMSKMKENNVMGSDVDILELVVRMKNFLGVELSGLVKFVMLFVFVRNIKVGIMVSVSEDVVNMKVGMQDFLYVLDEVKFVFGIDDLELEDVLLFGIIEYLRGISYIFKDGMFYVKIVKEQLNLRVMSVLFYGLRLSGKMVFVVKIVQLLDFFFIKFIILVLLVGYRDELVKKDYLYKLFMDVYKFLLSLFVIGKFCFF